MSTEKPRSASLPRFDGIESSGYASLDGPARQDGVPSFLFRLLGLAVVLAVVVVPAVLVTGNKSLRKLASVDETLNQTLAAWCVLNPHACGEGYHTLEDALYGLTPAFSFVEVWTTGDLPGFTLGIPLSSLNKTFIVNNLFSRTSGYGDEVLSTMSDYSTPVYKFEVGPDGLSVDLRKPQYDYRATDEQERYLQERGAWTGWEMNFPLLGVRNDPDTDELVLYIDFEPFALSGVFGVDPNGLVSELGGPTDARLVSCAAYERNVECELEYEFFDGQDTTQFGLYVSMALLPDDPMVGRVVDDRVGFFESSYVDLGEHYGTQKAHQLQDRVDNEVKLINRWRLERDAPCSAFPCPDSEQIVPQKEVIYYVDPTVPKRWREYIKQGIEVWQPAFAAVGFKNTPRAVLPQDDDFPSDYSPGDMRYSTVSFSVSIGSVFSVGPATVDPRTGEIMNADIGFAEEWVHAWTEEIEDSTAHTHHDHAQHLQRHTRRLRAAGNVAQRLEHLAEYAHQHSQQTAAADAAAHAEAHAPHLKHSHIHSRHGCEKGHAMEAEMPKLLMAYRRLRDAAHNTDDLREVIGAGLADVTAHEVGHTLGLRHNFKGTNTVPLDKLDDAAWTGAHGLSSSVMDYVPTNIAPTPAEQGDYFTGGTVLAAYDRWAIRYGYQFLEGEETGIAHAELDTIIESGKLDDGQPLKFGSDGDADAQDPWVRRYDQSDDPVGFSQRQIDLQESLKADAMARTVASGGQLTPLWEEWRTIMSEQYRAVAHAIDFVGGVSFDRRHATTPHAAETNGRLAGSAKPAEAVAAAYQDRAIELLKNIFSSAEALSPPAAMRPYMVRRPEGSDYALEAPDMTGNRDIYLGELLKTVADADRLQRVASWTALGGPTVDHVLRHITLAVYPLEASTAHAADAWRWPSLRLWLQLLKGIAECRQDVVKATAGAEVDYIADKLNALLSGTSTAAFKSFATQLVKLAEFDSCVDESTALSRYLLEE